MQDNANYSYMSKLVTPDQQVHYIKDSEARYAITNLEEHKVDVDSIDSVMSDTSENAIQNKVVKSYVDRQISSLGAILQFKGIKSSEAEIKAITAATLGDVWVNSADNHEWVCIETITEATPSAWTYLGITLTAEYASLAEIQSYIN